MDRNTSSLLFAAASLLALPLANAQSFTSGAQLKQACETSPGNVVQINSPTKIEFGPALPTPVVVDTACTLQIGPNANFGVKQVAMSFAGALNIQSVEKTSVMFEDSLWQATSIAVNLSAVSSELVSKQSRLSASAGNVSVVLGNVGKFEMINPFSGNPNGIEASGALLLSAGSNFSGVLGDVTVAAGTGIALSMGDNSVLKLDESNLRSTAGSVAINGAGNKVLVEMSQGVYSAPAGVSVTLPGAETGLMVKDGDFRTPQGAVTLTSGGDSNPFGGIEVNQTSFNASGAVQIVSGQGGKALVDNITANGASLEIRSGAQGSTLTKNSGGAAGSSVTVATGIGGVCIAQDNSFTAAAFNYCP